MNSIPSSAPATAAIAPDPPAAGGPANADPATATATAAPFAAFFTAATLPATPGHGAAASSCAGDPGAPADPGETADGTPRPPASASVAGATAWCLLVALPAPVAPPPAPPAAPPAPVAALATTVAAPPTPPAAEGNSVDRAAAPAPAATGGETPIPFQPADGRQLPASATPDPAGAPAIAGAIATAASAPALPGQAATAVTPAASLLPAAPAAPAAAGDPKTPDPVATFGDALGRVRLQGGAAPREKIAGSTDENAPAAGPDPAAAATAPRLDGSLASGPQAVKPGRGAVGIDRAQVSSAMRRPSDAPLAAPAARPAATGSADALPAPVASGSAAPAAQTAAPAPAPAATRHAVAAVESALDCIAQVRETGRTSVALDLSFADQTRLAVRIELREGTVHTTFRTDSAELRQALSHEWSLAAPAGQAAAGADRPVRIAEPVFAPATGSFDAGGSATGGGAHARAMPAEVPAAPAGARTAATARRDAPAESAPAPVLHPATSVRLHAFA